MFIQWFETQTLKGLVANILFTLLSWSSQLESKKLKLIKLYNCFKLWWSQCEVALRALFLQQVLYVSCSDIFIINFNLANYIMHCMSFILFARCSRALEMNCLNVTGLEGQPIPQMLIRRWFKPTSLPM